MAAFFLFVAAFIFAVGLINSYLFMSQTKLAAWFGSLKKPTKTGKEETKSAVSVDRVNIDDIFSMFDSDGDGFITRNELDNSLKRLGLIVDDSELLSMMEEVDANCDGLIDLKEFQQLYVTLIGSQVITNSGGHEDEGTIVADLKDAFDVFDHNKDGLITVEELRLVLNSLGFNQGAKLDYCKEMIGKVDVDGDGMVNFDEFKKMMLMF